MEDVTAWNGLHGAIVVNKKTWESYEKNCRLVKEAAFFSVYWYISKVNGSWHLGR